MLLLLLLQLLLPIIIVIIVADDMGSRTSHIQGHCCGKMSPIFVCRYSKFEEDLFPILEKKSSEKKEQFRRRNLFHLELKEVGFFFKQ